jgi:UrcA family protein
MDGRQMACLGAAGFVGTLLIVAITAPAHAQPQQPVTVIARQAQPVTASVPYGDLALATSAGQRVLNHRISAALSKLCPNLDIDGFVYDSQDCRDHALAGALPQVRQAIDLARSGTSLAMAIQITAMPR